MNTLSHKHNWFILGGLSFLAVIITAWGYLVWNPPSPKLPQTAPVEKLTLTTPIMGATDPAIGALHADITIVEFGDFLCPSCADLNTSLKKIMAENPRVRLIWKDMPNTNIHPLAREASIAARCAGNEGKFWEYHDALLERQNEIANAAIFGDIAKELKLNTTAFEACQISEGVAQAIDLTIAEGLALGVDATPYFFIGTERGSFDARAIERIIKTSKP